MEQHMKTVLAIFSDLPSAQAARRELESARVATSVSLIENDQDSTVPHTAYGDKPEGGVMGFFARLFGMDEPQNLQNSPEKYRYFEDHYTAKKHILVVRDCSNVETVKVIVARNGGQLEQAGSDIYESLLIDTETTGIDREEKVLRLEEEQLKVSKERVSTGEVSVRKEIVEEVRTVEVPVTREEIVIERRSIDGYARPGSLEAASAESETIRVPMSEERVVVEKEVVPREEIVLKKTAETDKRVVSETVRHEEARIESDKKNLKDMAYRKTSAKTDSSQPSI